MDEAFREGIKVAAGTIGAFVGGLLMRMGWRKAKTPPGRRISSKEWHELRNRVNRLVWELERLQRDLGKLEARVDEMRADDMRAER
jgi:hypothetical protein